MPPNCRCTGFDIPGNLLREEIPQMVTITFESAVRTMEFFHLYRQVFKRLTRGRRREARRNPNSCPVVGTFFVSHQFTDYAVVQNLYADGHEMAALSISHRWPTTFWQTASAQQWAQEIADQRLIFEELGKVPSDKIVGMRAPYLQVGRREISSICFQQHASSGQQQ
ncbi:PREDICTED: uncharacterized protein LOC106806230 [Priapulus caudatus]|uniref:Uncharacterized protein LOC106806230 n=1 Tax=Priapulus caudatus TaxID=37621 RepID=A0ABM1DUG7_PRICU|nr:PREDICTED: uncharacterized protein LOC106806230 [Priapulus caudatus]